MRSTRRLSILGLALWVLAFALPVAVAQTTGQTALAGSKTWLDRRQEIEEFLKVAEIRSLEPIGIGVTKPWRADLAPGGPIDRMAWKPLKPAMYKGFWESYKSEIAAYELDKLLGLDMVPPKVERRVEGEAGAAIMWIAPAQSFRELGGVPKPPPAQLEWWNQQLIRAKMFDNLIGNKDPNLGNWLLDPVWNIILIDSSRAFTTTRDMVHEMTRIDPALWDKMKALTEEGLTPAVGKWLGKGEIRAILQRRDKMQEIVDKLAAKRSSSFKSSDSFLPTTPLRRSAPR